MPVPDDCTGTLAIASVSMNGPAWSVLDVIDLWFGGELEGGDRPVPGGPAIPNPRSFTITDHELPMIIRGEVDRLGVVQANPWAGLEANITYLRANVIDPPTIADPVTEDGTVPAVLTMPSGATRNADITGLALRIGDKGHGFDSITGRWGVIALATLEFTVPAGVFV